MNTMLIKPAKTTLILSLLMLIAWTFLTIPCKGFSEIYGAVADNAVETVEKQSISGIKGPVNVILVTNGNEENYEYFPAKCADFLVYVGISAEEIDYINVSKEAMLFDNMIIDIATVEYEYITVNEEISYGYDITDVDTVPKGDINIISEGVPGEKTVTYCQKKVDGVVADVVIEEEQILSLPINGTAERGIGGTVTASDGTVYKYSYKRLMEATAYTYVPGKTTWTTATGAKLDKGIVAVDPKEIPMHTKMYIASSTFEYGYGVAEDTGGAIKGNIIDLAFLTVDECINFGRRNIWVYFLEE